MMRVRAPVSLVLLVAAIGLLLCIDNVDSGPVAAASRYYGEVSGSNSRSSAAAGG